jgi:hypothetical protein
MSETLIAILLAPVGIVVYGSGLLLWPVRRWLRRKQVRGKTLGFVFLAQLVSYAAVACCSIFIPLGHFYYWFIFLIELNIAFTIAAVVAWIRDARYERTLEAGHAA